MVSFTVMIMFDRHVPEMDASMVIQALRDSAWDEIVTQSRQLSLAAQWAAVHSPVDLPSAGAGRLSVVGERAVRYGGPGTPKVVEFAAAELAPEVRLSVYQSHSLIADAVDLKFRFPLIWERLRRCQVRAYVARQIARRTRELPFDVAQRIDRLLVDKVTNLPPQRIEHLVDAALVKADPEGVRQAVEQAKRARLVHLSESTPYGIRSLYARLDAPDATRLKAMISRLTDILMNSPEPIPGVRYGDARTRSEWEAIALATLGNPGLAFRILVEHDQPDLFTQTSGCSLRILMRPSMTRRLRSTMTSMAKCRPTICRRIRRPSRPMILLILGVWMSPMPIRLMAGILHGTRSLMDPLVPWSAKHPGRRLSKLWSRRSTRPNSSRR